MRMCRGTVGGLTWRFVYNGDRVLELTDDANTPLVRYATENGSYYSPYLRANIIETGVRERPSATRSTMAAGTSPGWWM